MCAADRPFTDSEVRFLKYIRQWGKKVVFLVNKVDILSGSNEVSEPSLLMMSFQTSPPRCCYAMHIFLGRTVDDCRGGSNGSSRGCADSRGAWVYRWVVRWMRWRNLWRTTRGGCWAWTLPRCCQCRPEQRCRPNSTPPTPVTASLVRATTLHCLLETNQACIVGI